MSAAEVLDRPHLAEESRTKRLKAATHSAHERLDQRIMRANPFADRESYGRFLILQYRFHRDLDALFSNADLDALLPDLAGRNRLAFVGQDLADLGLAVPDASEPPIFAAGQSIDLAEALGWLYVIEGSNLGAAFLLKYAAKLGLDENFGARHLAGSPTGRGLHWRTFTAALDGIDLSGEAEQRAIAGAEAAFRRVHALAEECFA
ncbi:heme oxygenase [Neorhizobium galegae]|uniref:biliverdin-producing heme oxygenase n=1 Tax=Neorhizobium galegae TaxID=399 RepID=UPI001AEAC971|nr:biliverdin-producing heme oxygenase [Neorhizobium galegae]MBP2549214.1 heme oxygenase [Neorhizobium galegae]